MSATARAEARRKAILSRGTDRLAKLTTSARGEDAPAFQHDDPPVPSINSFVGEETTVNMPHVRTPSDAGVPAPDPSVWSEEKQKQFLAAFMGANQLPSSNDFLPQATPFDQPSLAPNGEDMQMPQGADNPLVALMSSFVPQNNDSNIKPVKPPSALQKLMPVIHFIAVWALLAYFVLWKEPEMFEGRVGLSAGSGISKWRRWSDLASRSAGESIRGVQVVGFFWAFTTLQIVLHSLRIFSGFDSTQPPALLSLVLPHLPPPFPNIIINCLKYLQMSGVFFDDLAALLVGVGFIVVVSGYFYG